MRIHLPIGILVRPPEPDRQRFHSGSHFGSSPGFFRYEIVESVPGGYTDPIFSLERISEIELIVYFNRLGGGPGHNRTVDTLIFSLFQLHIICSHLNSNYHITIRLTYAFLRIADEWPIVANQGNLSIGYKLATRWSP